MAYTATITILWDERNTQVSKELRNQSQPNRRHVMRVAICVRVSTQRQAHIQTVEQWVERLRAHVEAQGWVLEPEHTRRDDGYRGAKLNRPGRASIDLIELPSLVKLRLGRRGGAVHSSVALAFCDCAS